MLQMCHRTHSQLLLSQLGQCTSVCWPTDARFRPQVSKFVPVKDGWCGNLEREDGLGVFWGGVRGQTGSGSGWDWPQQCRPDPNLSMAWLALLGRSNSQQLCH